MSEDKPEWNQQEWEKLVQFDHEKYDKAFEAVRARHAAPEPVVESKWRRLDRLAMTVLLVGGMSWIMWHFKLIGANTISYGAIAFSLIATAYSRFSIHSTNLLDRLQSLMLTFTVDLLIVSAAIRWVVWMFK